MKAIDVIVIGELNIDIILDRINAFPVVGKEMIANEMTTTLGSSSAIFASNLSSLGAKVSFIGKIGKDDFGQIVLQSLSTRGVDTSLIQESTLLKTGATLVLNFQEDRAMVTYPGAMDDLSIEDIAPRNLQQARHLHFSSYFLQPGIRKDIGKVFRLAKEYGLTTSFDPQWDPQETWQMNMEEILPYVDVFLPNEKELANLTGKGSVHEALDMLKDVVNVVVVKMGNKGSLSWYNGKLVHKEPFLNKVVVDAIGAGDSFNAGFIFRYIQGHPVEACQEFGNLTGAISTTEQGGTRAFRDQEKIMTIAKERFGYAG